VVTTHQRTTYQRGEDNRQLGETRKGSKSLPVKFSWHESVVTMNFGSDIIFVADKAMAMKRTRQPKTKGEVDMPDQVKVYLPTQKGLELVWVKITEGDKFSGKGIIEQVPKAAQMGRSKFRLGDEIEYSGGNERVYAKCVRKLSNKLDEIKQHLENEIRDSMLKNFGTPRPERY
jgi:hypothetical protein